MSNVNDVVKRTVANEVEGVLTQQEIMKDSMETNFREMKKTINAE